MYGAFIGDIVGSKYEFNNIKTKNFPLFSSGCDYTDDTIMTVAVARAITLSLADREKGGDRRFQSFLVETMQELGRRYPYPTGAYGGNFSLWLRSRDPKPYGSFGNGSAMRVSPCALIAVAPEEALALARASASVSHDHPEGIKGAESVAAAIFAAKTGRSKEEIRALVEKDYYKLGFTLDSIRDTYSFDSSCQGSVPQALEAFLESTSFVDAIRGAVSIGGDCDTTGAITGSVARAYYSAHGGESEIAETENEAKKYLEPEFVETADKFALLCAERAERYRLGEYTPVLTPEETRIFSKGTADCL